MLSEHELRYTYEDPIYNRLVIVPQYYNINHYHNKYEGLPLNSSLHVNKDVKPIEEKIRPLI